jgi:hypothetical protein
VNATASRREQRQGHRRLQEGRGRRPKIAGYPAKADPGQDQQGDGAIVHPVLLVLLVTMVYGPIAAMLVEMFPTASATPR